MNQKVLYVPPVLLFMVIVFRVSRETESNLEDLLIRNWFMQLRRLRNPMIFCLNIEEPQTWWCSSSPIPGDGVPGKPMIQVAVCRRLMAQYEYMQGEKIIFNLAFSSIETSAGLDDAYTHWDGQFVLLC